MKKFLLALLILPLLSQAQYSKTDSTKTTPRKANFPKYKTHTLYSYSIGVKVFGYEEMPQILNQVKETEFQSQTFSGIMLKFNDNQISYRISGNFYSDNVTFDNNCIECEQAKGKMTDNAIRFGFEKNIVYADLQPFFGVDMGYRRSKFKGSSQTHPNSEKVYTVPYDANTLKNSLSISPFLGIKYSFLGHLTISAESSFDILYSYEKQELNYKTSLTKNSYRKWEYLLRPVGLLGLQYNFAEQY